MRQSLVRRHKPFSRSRVWNEMIDRGFKPDIVAHNVMLEGLLKCKKSDAISCLKS